MGDEMKYSEGQRNQIYEKYLRPLNLKIKKLLLFVKIGPEDFLKNFINKLLVLVKFILNFRIEYFLNKKLDIEDLIYTID